MTLLIMLLVGFAGVVHPATMSVSPSTGSGSTQAFAFRYSAASAIRYVQFGISSSPLVLKNSCAFIYEVARDKLWMYDDAGGGRLQADNTSTARNSQCSAGQVKSGRAASWKGADINVLITFSAAFAGRKTVWMKTVTWSNTQQPELLNAGSWVVPGASTPPSMVSVVVNPVSATLRAGQTQQFGASVTGATNTGVTWAASAGTISIGGLFTAPTSVNAQQTLTVTATSVADVTKKAAATITVHPANTMISGAVTPSSLGAGTIVALTGAATAQATADALGNYSFTGLSNGTYTITPKRTRVVFTPPSRTITISGTSITANFTGAVQTWNISGSVSGSPAALTLSGTSAASTTTDNSGKFIFGGLTSGSYVVAPSRAGYTFTPRTALVKIDDESVSGVSFAAQAVPSNVTLSWAASTSPNVKGYNVYRGTTTGGPYTKLNISPVPALTYVDSGVSSGRVYFYVATSVDGSGNESTYSSEASAKIPAP